MSQCHGKQGNLIGSRLRRYCFDINDASPARDLQQEKETHRADAAADFRGRRSGCEHRPEMDARSIACLTS
jgi:hypothetical protein